MSSNSACRYLQCQLGNLMVVLRRGRGCNLAAVARASLRIRGGRAHDHPPARRDRHDPRRGRHPRPHRRSRRVRAQSAPPARAHRRHECQGAAACQDPQMPGHRVEAGRARRRRRVRAEGQRGRGDGPGRGPGRARHERGGRPAEIAAPRGARACRPHRRVRRRSEPDPRARRGGRRGRGHLAGLCRGQHGRQPLRRRAGRAGARARAADHASAASQLWRIAGLSRLGAASARLGGAPPGDRRGRRQGRADP